MQLRGKKIGILAIVVVYCLTFLIQSNFLFFQAWAKETNVPRVNIVAILVDDKIYNKIESGLHWYAADYVQGKLADTKALVLPLNLDNIKAYDIYRMLENIYFDGLKDVNSQLIGLIMFGNIPLPVVNQDGYVFPTIYPYVDFENQKYVWDKESQYFVPNGNPEGQVEIWHGLIDYGTDIQSYLNFFNKVKKYVDNPEEFIGDGMWYEDFVAQKQAFLDDSFQYYRNKIIFGEDIGYQRYSPLMKKLFSEESQNSSLDIISELSDAMGTSFEGMDDVEGLLSQSSEGSHSTKMIQQEIETSMLADYNELFGKSILSTIRENIFAGGRWIKLMRDSNGKATQVVDADNSASKIQLKDTMYLGNENLQGLIENLNLLMEKMVDKKIADNKYDMDIVVPLSYEKTRGIRFLNSSWFHSWFKMSSCYRFVERFDNYYFGTNARYIDNAQDLSIYRGTYRNLSDLNGITYDLLRNSDNPTASRYDSTNLRLKSIGSSYDIFSNQAEGNRGFMLSAAERDLDVYDEKKTLKDRTVKYRGWGGVVDVVWPESCGGDQVCEDLFDFSKRWWGGASPINLNMDSVSTGRYRLNSYLATDSWRSIFDLGGFQSLVSGADEGNSGRGWVDGSGVGPQNAATSFKAYEKYSSPTQRQGWRPEGGVYVRYNNNTPDVHVDVEGNAIDFAKINYRNLDEKVIKEWKIIPESSKIFSVDSNSASICPWFGGSTTNTKYTYKVISSIVKHVSTTEEEFNGIDKNKYGEGGTLWFYYNDLSSAYEKVQNNVSEIQKNLNIVKAGIEKKNVDIAGIIESLNGNISDLQKALEEEKSDEDSDDDSEGDSSSDGEKVVNSTADANIKQSLENFANSVQEEKKDLSDLYSLISSLSADEIPAIMEYIATQEGLSIEDFYATDRKENKSKIGFAQEWISTLKSSGANIKKGANDVIVMYGDLYGLIQQQQSNWEIISSSLKSLSSNTAKVDEITEVFNNIFVVSGEDSAIGDSSDSGVTSGVGSLTDADNEIILNKDTAECLIRDRKKCNSISSDKRSEGEGQEDTGGGLFDTFEGENGIDKMFDWLIEEDKKAPQIEKAAKNDNDFRKWLSKNSIDISKFTQADWINQYASWAQGPGYDSKGAKENHDLLLGVSEHISGINILTPDRPIDSPRYVSMQSIAGNEIKFIYPDLFKVEVYGEAGKDKNGYDVHKLLTKEKIKNNLSKYLQSKVNEYNLMLKMERSSSIVMRGLKSNYYNKLGDYKGATPTLEKSVRSYNYFTYEDFVKALGGEKMLDTIADMLYYQSLTNKKKLSSGLITEDIDFIKNSFNLNDKREEVLSDYLTEGEEKTKNQLLIPTYEKLGYEVAYVNSNGKDYIIPNVDENQELLTGLTKSDDLVNSRSKNMNKSEILEQSGEGGVADECNIPSNGRLPLFKLDGTSPWFEGLMCWMKTLKNKPFKVKLTFDSSLGEILKADSLGDVVEGVVGYSDLKQSFSDWGDSMSQYVDDWSSVINVNKDYDADKLITQMQVNAEKHNESLINQKMNDIELISTNVKISNSNAILSDSNPSSNLNILSSIDIGDITLKIIGTGDGCLMLNNENLCNGGFTRTFNPKTNPFYGLVKTADNVSGKVGLDIKIGVGGAYYEKVIKYTVSPGMLETVVINMGSNQTVAGMLTPIQIIGYDSNKNVAFWGTGKYNFTVSNGDFLKDGVYQKSFTTNDFRNLQFYYHAPLDAKDGSEAFIQVSKADNPENYLVTHRQKIVTANPEIQLNGDVILKGKDELSVDKSYRLSSDEGVYNGGKLNVSKLQKLDIYIKDLKGNIVDVDSQVIVASQKELVVVGKVQTTENNEYKFFETSKYNMNHGHLVVYYYPTTVAGKDTIKVDIPGLDSRVINLSILPSSLENVLIIPENEVLNLGDTMSVELFLSDIRGNTIDGVSSIKLKFDSDILEFSGYEGSDGEIDLSVNDGYKKLQITGVGAGLSYIIGGGTYAQVNVDKHIFPSSKLNVMYLNYFGNDWGNQWGYFSDNNKYIENLMTNSNKVITTTTQLISEDKIRRMVWKMQPGFRIWNPDGLDTKLIINNSEFDLSIGGITSLKKSYSSLAWTQATQEGMETVLGNNVGSTKGYIFFIPSNVKYTSDNGILYNEGNIVGNIMGGDIVLELSDDLLDNGDNIWNVIDKGVNYGTLVVHYPNYMPSVGDFNTPSKGYLINQTFTDGSTDKISSVGIFDALSEFELDTSYKSIQNSDDIEERIGFLGDFKNITLFAEGEVVGEATKKFGSELLINLGDPVLSRKDPNDFVYGTRFDGGIGNEIYVDSENDIYGTYQIDFNDDNQEDLLIVYRDGTIKLSKNYGGTPDLRNMQELMRIAVNIKNVFVGDVDGNHYDDIIVQTSNNQLRVYLNNGGIFDVDGYVVCLNQNVFEGDVSSTPSDLDGIFQIFVEDMDLDGIIDIVTYDNMGYIKVFYGGTTKGWGNYLSTEKYACDSGWFDRESSNITVVTALGVQISNDQIFDNSMLHWIGMSRPENNIDKSDIQQYGVNFDPDSLEGLIKTKDRNSDGDISLVMHEVMDNFDIQKASQQYVDEGAKFVDVTLYENELMGGGDGNNYVFAPSSFLDPNNPQDRGSVWKNYYMKDGSKSKILQNGDIVTVRVTVKASDSYSFRGAYADIIQGPWKLYFDDNQIFKGIRFIQNPSDAAVKRKDGNFAYIIDNIVLSPGDKLIFEYDLEYKQIPLKTVSLTYDTFYSKDLFPDIKSQSIDGCSKNFDVYVNSGKTRLFKKTEVDLQGMINDEYLREDSITEDYSENIINQGIDIQNLPGIVQDGISRVSLLGGKSAEITNDEGGRVDLKNMFNEAGISLNIDLNLFQKETEEIEGVIDDITKGMCNGFSFGGSSNCKGLPVPFNQAFLAPGQYHLFGCWQIPMGPLEGGLPSFFFPGTLWVPTPAGAVPVPIPYGLKQSASDEFVWPGGGVYPSMIRIYAAPTLTAQLGIAVCMSTQTVWGKIPSPFSDIMGNCVVFAVKPQCKGGGSSEDGLGGDTSDLDNPNETYVDYIEDVRDSGVCSQSQKGKMVTVEGKRSSPFDLFTWKNMDVGGGSSNDVEYNTSFMGIIALETSAYIGSSDDYEYGTSNSIKIGDVEILGGEFSINKIRGGLQQGVRKILIDKWLDPQIRYILNQLTKMHITIKFPNLSNLVGNDMALLSNISSAFKNNKSEKTEDNKKQGGISKWGDISKDSFNKLNDSINNPFEGLASLMNESNIINISTETVDVKVPWIFPEDINAYEIYLRQRLDENERIIADWDSVLRTFYTSCSKLPEGQQEQCRQEAMENLNSFIEFQGLDWKKMQDQIYANLMILQQYRNFPFEIYEWIHVIDRYMAEIASLINNTMGYLSYWTSANAERFVGYVDAIILIVNIIKTYQLLIDFPIEWGKNCGNCSKDTYDQYSCKLSLLCDMIQLPIIQIPNFKLPNITVDLSNIDLGLDIVLPKFNFQPVKINLPELPNLPEPPSFSINIKLFDLPNIPVLPEPPELPELPSFIPEIELELPMLPPAPEVPKLPDSIESIIKIAELIGKIYCIVKGQFGLVGESSVKAKIEQLTQRTYEVTWIDKIMDFTNVSIAPIHNYGVDYEIDSYVDIQFNFTDFYDYLDTLTKSINNLTTSTVNMVNQQIDNLSENPLSEVLQTIDKVDVDVDVDASGLMSMSDFNADVEGIMSDDVEYVDYELGKNRLKNVLTYFKREMKSTSLDDSIGLSIDKIERQIEKDHKITPNEEGIDNLRSTVMNYLDTQSVEYEKLENMIKTDYDGFLAMIDSQGIVSDQDDKMLTFGVNLFNIDSSTKDSIQNISRSNPYETLLDNKQTIIDGYRNAINGNSADDLGLTKSQYLVLRNDISSMRNQFNALYTMLKPERSTNLLSKNDGELYNKTLFAGGARIGSQMEAASVIDPSVVSKGIYEKIMEGKDVNKLTKVIYSDSFADSMGSTHYRTSHTSDHDIVLWDGNSIYKKCYNQNCINYGRTYNKYYHSSVINDIPYSESWIDFDRETKLKISDVVEEVKNRKVLGQNYESLSFAWTLSDVDAYLIKLVERVDYSYEKVDSSSKISKYVLALPDYVDLTGDTLNLELLNGKIDTIQNLSGKDLLQVVYYDSNKYEANVGVSDIDRKWYYSRIVGLNLIGDTYKIQSPRSNQIVAGRQIVGDDVEPMGDAVLYRVATDEIVSEGDNLEGYVGTEYKLIVNWKDNTSLSYINLSKDGDMLDEKYTSNAEDSVSAKISIHTKEGKELFNTVGIDQFGNRTEKVIMVEYVIPNIMITNVSESGNGESISVTAELSQDLDQGNVSFQKNRGDSRNTIKPNGSGDANFPLRPKQTMIYGSFFSFGNEIAMYDKKGEAIAVMDPDTAEIKINSGYNDLFGVRAVVQDRPLLQIYDKETQNSVFSLSLPVEKCVLIDAGNYEIADLPEKGNMGMFNGGKAIYKGGSNVLFVSPTCHLYSEIGMEGMYSYDRGLDAVVLTLYESSDLSKSNPIKIGFKVQPLK